MDSQDTENLHINLILNNIGNSRKYHSVSKDLIVRIGKKELETHGDIKIAIKETKRKLHQVVSVYQKGNISFTSYVTRLERAHSSNDFGLIKEICLDVMKLHVSTYERIPILTGFYQQIFSLLPTIHSILDIGCGLNPFSIPWMPLSDISDYFAWDISYDLEKFLNQSFRFLGVNGKASTIDFLASNILPSVDLAFLLKTIPCLSQIDKEGTINSFRNIPAKFLVISYPTRSIGGKNKGMDTYYDAHFMDIANKENWKFHKICFPNELVFVVMKGN